LVCLCGHPSAPDRVACHPEKHGFSNRDRIDALVETGSTHYQCIDPAILAKNVFFGGKRGRIQLKYVIWERGSKRPVEPQKTLVTIQCKTSPTEIPNFEWRAATAGPKPLAAARSYMVHHGGTWVLDLSGAGLSPSGFCWTSFLFFAGNVSLRTGPPPPVE